VKRPLLFYTIEVVFVHMYDLQGKVLGVAKEIKGCMGIASQISLCYSHKVQTLLKKTQGKHSMCTSRISAWRSIVTQKNG